MKTQFFSQCCKLHLRLYDLILWNMGRICVRSRNVLQYVSRHNVVADVLFETKHSSEFFFTISGVSNTPDKAPGPGFVYAACVTLKKDKSWQNLAL